MIKLSRVSFGYSKKQPLFQDLDLELYDGNVYGLLGANGAGKSSLLQLISGLLFPTSGQIQVNHFEPKDRKPAFLQDIFLIPEEFYMPPIRLKDYVNMYQCFYPKFSQELFHKILQEFDLEDIIRLDKISFGQRKKAIIAFALATQTQLLIMDEPTNGLDIRSKSQFRKVIAASATEDKIMIISTHQVRDLESIIDPILVLNEGKITLHRQENKLIKLDLEQLY